VSEALRPGDDDQEVREWLQSAAALTIPVDVERRVNDALAQESARRQGLVPGESSELAARRPWASRLLVAASVVAATVAVAAITVGVVGRQPDTVASGDFAAESVERVESSGQPAADADAATPILPEVPSDVLALVSDPATTPGPIACGEPLAQEVGAELGRSVEAGEAGGVLVVLVDARQRSVWWLPTCQSSAAQAYARSIAP
jgi:hypothetical protein